MYKEQRILAVIPARGGSKGLPRKNIRELNGKPLIAWTIEAAKDSRLLDKIVVSTEDQEIAAVSSTFGMPVPFMRPEELASDEATTFSVLEHVVQMLKKQGENYDVIVLLEPTSPLRETNDIDNMIKSFLDNPGLDSLVSIGEIATEHPLIAKKIRDGLVVSFFENSSHASRRQDNEPAFFPYGVAYLAKISTFLEQKTFYGSKCGYYKIKRYQNYEVDDIYDFLAVESIMKYTGVQK